MKLKASLISFGRCPSTVMNLSTRTQVLLKCGSERLSLKWNRSQWILGVPFKRLPVGIETLPAAEEIFFRIIVNKYFYFTMTRTLSTLLILSAFLISCQRDTPSPLDDILQANKEVVSLDNTSSSKDTIQITSNTEWLVTVPPNATWLTVEPSSGNGNGSIILSSTEENPGATRTVEVEIKTKSGGKTVSITVTQTESGDSTFMAVIGVDESDVFSDFVETAEGDFIAVGHAPNSTQQSPRVVRFNKQGNVIWDKVFDDGVGFGYAIARTTSDVYVVLVWAAVSDRLFDADVWLIGMNVQGDVLWNKKMGGSKDDQCYSVEATSDGNVLLAGETSSNDLDVTSNTSTSNQQFAWLVKVSDAGEIIWENTYSRSPINSFIHATPLQDGGIIFGGEYYVEGGSQNKRPVWYGKIAADGAMEWSDTLETGRVWITLERNDGDYLFGGISYQPGDFPNYHGGNDAMLICTDAAGNLKWKNAYGGSGHDAFYSLTEFPPDRIVAAGYSSSTDGDISGNHGARDALVMEIGESGEIVKSKLFGGSAADEAGSILTTQFNRLAFVGVSSSYIDINPDLPSPVNSWFVIPDF